MKRPVAGKRKAGKKSSAAPRRACGPARRRQRSDHLRTEEEDASEESHRRRQEGTPERAEEHGSGARPYQEHIQQHHCLDHRPWRQRHFLGLVRAGRVQGLAQVHAVRRADGRGGRRPPGHGARHAEGRRVREGSGLGPGDRHPVAAGDRPGGRLDPGRHPGSAQWLPPAQAAAGLRSKATMARYTGPDCKRCRREKTKLFLKGAKCDSPKCPIEIRPSPPGEHGRNRPKENDYLLQVREKQKAKRIYGILERQFHNYYEEASLTRGRTGEALLQILETRLDNVVYRAGFAKSRDMARQIVRHGHVLVNGRKVDIPSFRVSAADIVEVAAKSRELTPFAVARAEAGERTVPAWLEVIPDKMRILVHALPARAQIDTLVQEQLIVEYYSK